MLSKKLYNDIMKIIFESGMVQVHIFPVVICDSETAKVLA